MSYRHSHDYGQTVAVAGRSRKPYGGARQVILVHGEKVTTIPVPPWIAISLGFVVAVMAAALTISTCYLVLRDDLIRTAYQRNSELVRNYEDRVASLRSEIDRISSHQILDQMAFDEKIDRLLSAQQMLDGRQKLVSELVSRANHDGLMSGASAINPMDAPSQSLAPAQPDANGKAPLSPEADVGKQSYAPEATGSVNKAQLAFDALSRPDPNAVQIASVDATIVSRDPESGRRIIDTDALAARLRRMTEDQTSAVTRIGQAADNRATRVEKVLQKIGFTAPENNGRYQVQPDANAEGGPLLPANSSGLKEAYDRANQAMDHLTELSVYTRQLPLDEPVPGAVITSGFGNRPDPFLGSLAFHPGIDFRLPYGSDVPATAAGTVTNASWAGGYGNMVEIDHGHGIATRYGHLSEIKVKVGQHIEKGQIVGEVGSTGRSTGPHLHYETREDGEPLNPITWLDAGDQIHGLLPMIE